MTLDEFIRNLQALQGEHGHKKVFSVHGASGCTYELRSARVSDYIGESGPFDLEPGEEYISIYAGN